MIIKREKRWKTKMCFDFAFILLSILLYAVIFPFLCVVFRVYFIGEPLEAKKNTA